MKLQLNGLKVDGGGEGSRGGVVIGRTSGGKPIYKNHEHPSHKLFTAKDHDEAAAVQTKLGHSAFAEMSKAERSGSERKLELAKKKVNLHGFARRFHLKKGTENIRPETARIGFIQ